MKNNKSLNVVIDVIESYKNFYFCKWDDKYIILNKKDNKEIIEQKFGHITYYSKFNMDETHENYELIAFDENICYEISYAFFKLIIFATIELPKTLESINEIFTQLKKELSLSQKRGIFAELYSIVFDNFKPKKHKNATYDMFNENGNDVEIKSYSKTKRTITLSYHQLTDNKEAKIVSYEVIESSEGVNLYELYLKLPAIYKNRYFYLEFFKDDKDRFKINKNTKIDFFVKDINKNLKLPYGCNDAHFVFNLDFFIKKTSKIT